MLDLIMWDFFYNFGDMLNIISLNLWFGYYLEVEYIYGFLRLNFFM